MADRALTPGQAIVLATLQRSGLDHGLLSGSMVHDRRAAWTRPKLEALRRRGFVRRHATNVERWYVTKEGLAVVLNQPEPAHG